MKIKELKFWMNMIIKKWILLFVGVIVVLGMPGCRIHQNDEVSMLPIKIELSLSKIPNIGETVEIYATISSVRDIENTSARITLPSGIQFVSGNLTWEGDVIADTPIVFTAKIKVLEDGNWIIKGEESSGAVSLLYLSVKDGIGTLYERGFPHEYNSNITELSPCPLGCEKINNECICK